MTLPGAAERLSAVRTSAASAGVDLLLITPGPDLRWLTGYDALPLERLTCLVVPTESTQEPALVVPRLEVAAAKAAGVGDLGLEIVGWDETDDPYAEIARRYPAPARVGLADAMWAEKVLAFRRIFPDAEQVLASTVVRDLRMRKTPDEIDALREAGQAIDRVHTRMGEFLKIGSTEREAGRLIAEAILDEGHVGLSFPVMVGSGPNGASPHHETSDRRIERGDVVLIDIGGVTAKGYCSDCTRMYVVGAEPPVEFEEYFAVLHSAQAAAVEHARAGVTAESVDAAARTVITDAGYGEQFFHRVGHGIGVEVHEDPYMVGGNTLVLEPGMTFSIEPGIYFEGKHGARIEDIVAVTPDGSGVERLNVTDRDYVVLPG